MSPDEIKKSCSEEKSGSSCCSTSKASCGGSTPSKDSCGCSTPAEASCGCGSNGGPCWISITLFVLLILAALGVGAHALVNRQAETKEVVRQAAPAPVSAPGADRK